MIKYLVYLVKVPPQAVPVHDAGTPPGAEELCAVPHGRRGQGTRRTRRRRTRLVALPVDRPQTTSPLHAHRRHVITLLQEQVTTQYSRSEDRCAP